MHNLKEWFWLPVFFVLFLVTPAFSLEKGDIVPPFTVLSHEGEPFTEENLLGKLSVVFYDTRHTASWNNDLKYAIGEFREKHLPLLANLEVIQIIDASSANFLTRSIWKRKLRENARKYGVTLYADWSGGMRRDFSFSARESNVLVVDTHGTVRYTFRGKVPENEKNQLFSLLLTLGEEMQRRGEKP